MYELLKNEFDLISQGTVEIKGKGMMETFRLLGLKSTIHNKA